MKLARPLIVAMALAASLAHAADDPPIAARKAQREQMVEVAGKARALSKEMPQEVKQLPVFGETEWVVKKMPFIAPGPHGGVSGGGMVVVDGRIYYVGGFIPAGDGTDEPGNRTSRWAQVYDPQTDQWTPLPDLPARREYTRSIATDDAVYVTGGFAQGKPGMPAAEVFCLKVREQPLKWQTMASLKVPRSHTASDRVGNALIVAGGNRYDIAEKGYSAKTIQGVTELLDLDQPGSKWQTMQPIPGAPRGWCASAVLNERFYMLGGVTWTAKARERLKECLCFDPKTNQWSALAEFPIPISGWEGSPYAGRYIITVGGAGARWNDVAFVYDTQENRWMRCTGALPPGGVFNDPGVCIIGDHIYVAGGEGPGGSHFDHFLIGTIKPLTP